jgi:sugar phosphate isomerase/epimerase
VDTSCFFHHCDALGRRRAIEEGRRMLALAAALGAPGIRIFGDRVQPGATRDETEAWIADGLQILADEGRALGVGAWLETHGDFAAAPATEAILARVRVAPAVGVVWDPANAFAEFGEAPADGWAVIGKRVRHVHIKDIRPPADPSAARSTPWTPVLMGIGTFPAKDVVALLAHVGFDGYLSYEWEKRWHPAIEQPEVALPHFAAWYGRASC